MSMGFQITQYDVETVLDSYNVSYDNRIEEIMEGIDDDAISKAALAIDVDPFDDDELTLLKQTEAAYDEIAWQLYQDGIISKKQIKQYGNTDLLHRKQ